MMTQTAEHYEVYEVFVQDHHLEHHHHVGSVVAPSPDLALDVARETFLRRDDAVSIWVVRQNHVHATSYQDMDFLANRTLSKDYRDVAGYSDNARLWKEFKHKAMTIEDVVNDMKGS